MVVGVDTVVSLVDNAFVGITVSVGMSLASGAQEASIRKTSGILTIFLIFIDVLLCQEQPNGLRLRQHPAEGWWARQDNAILAETT